MAREEVVVTPLAVFFRCTGLRPQFTRYDERGDSRGWRLVLLAAALFDAVMLAGCATEGTTRILSYYGDWTGVKPGQRPAPHRGVDFDASKGDPVIAATDGTVVRVFADGLCGNGIVAQHLVGETIWRTIYCHLDETNVQPGQQVKRGDVLGKAGTTGNSLGVPHLHFGLKPGGESFDTIDPRPFYEDTIDPLPFIVGCFDPAKTVAYSTLEASSAKPRLVLTYPVPCGRGVK